MLLLPSKYKRGDAQFYKRQSLVILLPIHSYIENIVAFVINAGYKCRRCQEFLLNSVIQVVQSSKTALSCAALDKFLSTSMKRKTIHKNVGFIQCFYKEPRGFPRIFSYAVLLRLIDAFLDAKDFW